MKLHQHPEAPQACAAADGAVDNDTPQSKRASSRDHVRRRFIQVGVLVLLTAQNCALMLVTSYSRSLPPPHYLASTAVVAAELLKTFIIFTVLVCQNGVFAVCHVLKVEILAKKQQTMRFAVPAIFYTLQNNFWYYGMTNLDSVTAAVTSQLKVPSTALFSVWMLHKELSTLRWAAIALLLFGLVTMQAHGSEESDGALQSAAEGRSYYTGMAAMVVASGSSGFAGIYLEKLFKQIDVSIWVSNLQLQLFCMPVAMMAVLSDLMPTDDQMQDHLNSDIFVGWSSTTCLVVILNALGGFMVTLTMKYADNILKTFAVSMSLVLNCGLSWALFDSPLVLQDAIGVCFVIGGTWLYNSGAQSSDHANNAKAPPASEHHSILGHRHPPPCALDDDDAESVGSRPTPRLADVESGEPFPGTRQISPVGQRSLDSLIEEAL